MNDETKQTLKNLLAALKEHQQKAGRNAHTMRSTGDESAERYYNGQHDAYQCAIQDVEAFLSPERIPLDPETQPPGSYFDPKTPPGNEVPG